MRTKIFLIQGQHQLAQKITLGEFQRVNIDTLIHILALRDGHSISAYDPQNITETVQHQTEIDEFVTSLEDENCQHMLASEYADAIVDRGQCDIRAVEGFSMNTEWVYDMVQAFHKNFGKVCVRIKCGLPQARWVSIDDVRHEWREAMEILCPNPSLG